MENKGKTWSRGTNSCLPFGVNVDLNLSNIFINEWEKRNAIWVTDRLI